MLLPSGAAFAERKATMSRSLITRIVAPILVVATLGRCLVAQDAVSWQKLVLTDRYYCDGITSGDINQDGIVDIVAGPFWYAGPTFQESHEFYQAVPLPPEESPSNSMFSFVHDFSGDGRLDILVLGRVHLHAAYWYENPGGERVGHDLWERHFAFERVRGESPTLVDLDGDGVPQLICHWDNRWGWIEPARDDPYAPWTFRPIGPEQEWDEFYHGEGVGDVNSDGLLDLVINDGWFEQPATGSGDESREWEFHLYRFAEGRGGAQMFVDDIDADGDADIVTALDAHGWGLAWLEQLDGSNGTRFEQHRIIGDRGEEAEFGVAFSQPHALDYADINGDGRRDIIVGKRMWAHGPTGDIEPDAAPVVYWFEWTQKDSGDVHFIPHLIDDHSGVGVQIWVADVNADDRLDVLAASKLGTFVFQNRRSD